jgi:hypothetical protein
VSLEDLDKVVESGKTVDIAPPTPTNPLLDLIKQPLVILLMSAQGLSLLVILVLIVLVMKH